VEAYRVQDDENQKAECASEEGGQKCVKSIPEQNNISDSVVCILVKENRKQMVKKLLVSLDCILTLQTKDAKSEKSHSLGLVELHPDS